jgi:hypothetical protein
MFLQYDCRRFEKDSYFRKQRKNNCSNIDIPRRKLIVWYSKKWYAMLTQCINSLKITIILYRCINNSASMMLTNEIEHYMQRCCLPFRGIWVHPRFLVLSVLLRYTDSDCPFGIFKLFLYIAIWIWHFTCKLKKCNWNVDSMHKFLENNHYSL